MAHFTRTYAFVAALLACAACAGSSAEEPEGSGWLRVQIVTTGVDLDTLYWLEVDNRTGRNAVIVGSNETQLVDAAAGDADVILWGIEPNCTPSGSDARTVRVPANDTVVVTFSVTCTAFTGSIFVRVGFTGVDPDIDGYILQLDGFELGRTVGVVDSVYFPRTPSGTHQILLRGVAANCTVATDTLQTASLAVGDTVRIQWNVTCVEAISRPLLMVGAPGWLDGYGRIYLRRPHDTTLVNLTGNGTLNAWARWSPDGQHISFQSERTGRAEVFVMDSGGNGVVQLTNASGGNTQPAWSPDGQRIAFTSGRGGHNAIYVMNTDGSGQTRFTTDTMDERYPSWSPDGIRIAYVRRCRQCAAGDLFVSDGNVTTQLTATGRVDFDPVWSPDGAKIAFTSGDSLGVVDGDGAHPMWRARHSLPWSPSSAAPSWSPDSKQIAYAGGSVDGPPWSGIHVVRADGTGDRALTVEGMNPAWSADGSTIAFAQPECFYGRITLCMFGKLMVMKPDGSRLVRLTYTAPVDEPAWAP